MKKGKLMRIENSQEQAFSYNPTETNGLQDLDIATENIEVSNDFSKKEELIKKLQAEALKSTAYENNLVDIQFDETNPGEVTTVQCGAEIPIIGDIIGGIKDIFDGDTKDGEIDGTKQGQTGDCWLLSGINALSYTEEGRKLIKEALEYHDGYTIVRLAGGATYKITDSELRSAKGSIRYASGDDDVIILELALEKMFDDVANGDLKFDGPWDSTLNKRTETSIGNSSIIGGTSLDLIYLITGKTGDRCAASKDGEEILERFQKSNGKDFALCANTSFIDTQTVKDVNGKDVKIIGGHGYAVKSVTADTVTVTNPWNSNEEIVLSKEVFFQTFSLLEYCDLSDNNPKKTRAMRPNIDKDGNKIYTRPCDESEVFDYHGDKSECKTEKSIYSKTGQLLELIYYDENGIPRFSRKYDENGKITETTEYNKDGKSGLVRQYDKDGKVSYVLRKFDDDGSSNYTIYIKDEETARTIMSRGLLNYPQFSTDEIDLLAHVPQKDWGKVMNILKKNPNASFAEIMKEL